MIGAVVYVIGFAFTVGILNYHYLATGRTWGKAFESSPLPLLTPLVWPLGLPCMFAIMVTTNAGLRARRRRLELKEQEEELARISADLT